MSDQWGLNQPKTWSAVQYRISVRNTSWTQNLFISYPIVLHRARQCYQTNWAIGTEVMYEEDFACFKFRTDILYCTAHQPLIFEENAMITNHTKICCGRGRNCKHATYVNTLTPKQNGHHFLDDIFKCIFLNENVSIANKISLKFVPKGPINNIPALVQVMAWCRAAIIWTNGG